MVQTYPRWDVNHQDVQGAIWDRVNVSFSLSLPLRSLATVIGKENRDASGRRLDPKLHEKLSNLRKWDLHFAVRLGNEKPKSSGLIA